jgi:hypothetical protein
MRGMSVVAFVLTCLTVGLALILVLGGMMLALSVIRYWLAAVSLCDAVTKADELVGKQLSTFGPFGPGVINQFRIATFLEGTSHEDNPEVLEQKNRCRRIIRFRDLLTRWMARAFMVFCIFVVMRVAVGKLFGV